MTDDNDHTIPWDGGEADGDQLSAEDTLIDRGVDDLLDEGYSPPERPAGESFGTTGAEAAEGERIEQRVAQEQPEVWDPEYRPPVDADRAGRLTAAEVPEAGADGVNQDVFAADCGIDGGAASAEEAAMHVVGDDAPDNGLDVSDEDEFEESDED